MSGGEDYGLVFTVRSGRAAELERKFPEAYRLGVITKQKGVRCDGGCKTKIFEHF